MMEQTSENVDQDHKKMERKKIQMGRRSCCVYVCRQGIFSD